MSENTSDDAPKNDPRPGLEQIAAFARGEYPTSPMTKLIPFETLPPEKGKLQFRATPDDTHLNGMGIVHGGWAIAQPHLSGPF